MNAPRTATGKIRTRIQRKRPGWVFTPFDFADIGPSNTVGMALNRLQHEGMIRRLAHGVYDAPKEHPRLGKLTPTPDEIARALARKGSARIQPSGVTAANMLSLSEQVPAHAVYETDGSSRTVRVGKQTIQLKKAAPRKLHAARTSSLIFAALRGIGKEHVDNRRLARLRSTLSAADRKRLLADLPQAPGWMHRYIRYIAEGSKTAAST